MAKHDFFCRFNIPNVVIICVGPILTVALATLNLHALIQVGTTNLHGCRQRARKLLLQPDTLELHPRNRLANVIFIHRLHNVGVEDCLQLKLSFK